MNTEELRRAAARFESSTHTAIHVADRMDDAVQRLACMLDPGYGGAALRLIELLERAVEKQEPGCSKTGNNIPVAWRYRFKNSKGWGNWFIHHGADKPVNVAFEAMEAWPLFTHHSPLMPVQLSDDALRKIVNNIFGSGAIVGETFVLVQHVQDALIAEMDKARSGEES